MATALTTAITVGSTATQYALDRVAFDRDAASVTSVVQLLDGTGKVVRTVTTTEPLADAGITGADLSTLRSKIVTRLKALGVIN